VHPLFRYFSEQNAHAFLTKGEILLRSLSYFRDYEDQGVRSDEYEGTLLHRPNEGLRIKLSGSGEEVTIPYTFESSAREDAIFVYCMSTHLDNNIAKRFQAHIAVEITDPVKLIALMRNAMSLRSRLRAEKLIYGEVKYYELHEPPIVDWALPERIAMRKRKSFEWQREYRFAVPLGDAFKVEQVQTQLVPLGVQRNQRAQSHPSICLRLGSLSKICRIHKFAN
jgi:hypothetical protein